MVLRALLLVACVSVRLTHAGPCCAWVGRVRVDEAPWSAFHETAATTHVYTSSLLLRTAERRVNPNTPYERVVVDVTWDVEHLPDAVFRGSVVVFKKLRIAVFRPRLAKAYAAKHGGAVSVDGARLRRASTLRA